MVDETVPPEYVVAYAAGVLSSLGPKRANPRTLAKWIADFGMGQWPPELLTELACVWLRAHVDPGAAARLAAGWFENKAMPGGF